jgi:hypothetical protein
MGLLVGAERSRVTVVESDVFVHVENGYTAPVEAYRIFQEPVFLQRCSAYLGWLENHVNADGSYLNPVMEVGSATAPIFLFSYRTIAPAEEKARIDRLIEHNLGYLLSIQKQDTGNPLVDGAFLGMDHQCKCGYGNFINIRCSAYAIIALCRALDSSWFPLSMAGDSRSRMSL